MLTKLWYFRATLTLVMACGLVLMPIGLFLDMGPLDINETVTETIGAITFFLLLGSGSCLIWLCPYLASGDDALVFIHTPRRTIKDLRSMIWLAPLGTFFIGILMPTSLILVGGLDIMGKYLVFNGVITLSAGLVMVIPSSWVSKKIGPRIIEMVHRRKICFECGYNLRGNPDATICPECGAAVPVGMSEKNDTTVNPGQGPAGHDRA